MNLDEVLRDIESDIESEVEILEEFQNWIDDTLNDWDSKDVDAPEEAFKSSLRRYEDRISDDMTINELTELYNELEEAYSTPVLNSIRAHIEDIFRYCTDDYSERQISRITEQISQRNDRSLVELREEIVELTNRLDTNPEVVRKIYGKDLEKDPYILVEPDEIAKERLIDHEHNYSALSSISGILSEFTWAPEEVLPLQTQEKYYPSGLVDQQEAVDFIYQIEDINSDCKSVGISAHKAIRKSLIQNLDSSSIVEKALADTVEEWDSATERLSPIITANSTIKEVDMSEYGVAELEESLSRLTDTNYSDRASFESDLEEFGSEFQLWKEGIGEKLKSRQATLDNFKERFEFADGEPPELPKNEEYQDESKIVGALQALGLADSWIETKVEETTNEFSEEGTEVFRELMEGNEVSLKRCSDQTIDELRGFLPVVISIDE